LEATETEEEKWNRRNLKRLSLTDLLRLEASENVSAAFKNQVTEEIERTRR